MNRKRTIWLVLVTLAVAGVATMEYWDRHPVSAVPPMWIRGEFGASAERYAGRTVTVDSSMIRFSHGESGADVLPIEWIEKIKDARSNVRILDLHVRDGPARACGGGHRRDCGTDGSILGARARNERCG